MPRQRASVVSPQLATLVDDVPEGEAWLHEIKLDGYRLLAHKRNERVALTTRGGLDWAARVPHVARAIAALPAHDVLLDGELVVLDARGVSDFQALQGSLSVGKDGDCVYFAFDLLSLEGVPLMPLALEQRKQHLERLLGMRRKGSAQVRYGDHVVGDGAAFLRQACARGLEGIVSKRRDRPYRPGRGLDWLKVKCRRRQEFVIGGFSEPSGSRAHFGALLLGLYDDAGRLRYAGKVGTGFDEASLVQVHGRLAPLVQERPAFAEPPTGAEARGVAWTAPLLLAEIEYAEITRDGRVRHASFRGLREDKPARSAHLEVPRPTPSQ